MPADEDLTARARIRDAALQLFAERGIERATIRDIAKAAGVSSGLVRHHFGSKEALRDACDSYATGRLQQFREEMFQQGRLADSGSMVSMHPAVMALQAYLVRSMMDGSPAAAALFEQMVGVGEQWLAGAGVETRDLRAYSAVLVAMQLGVFVLGDQLSRSLGVDVRTTEGNVRMNRGFVDVFANPLLTPEEAGRLHATLDRLAPPTTDPPDTATPTSHPQDATPPMPQPQDVASRTHQPQDKEYDDE